MGEVYDALTSKPIAGSVVALTQNKGQNENREYVWETVATGRADDNGRFEVKGIPPGTYRVTASAPSAVPRVLGYAQFGTNTFKRYAFRLSPPAAIRGTVTDTDGKPVAGVTVRADAIMGPDGRGYDLPDRPQTTTGDDGTFALDNLPHGHCQLHAHRQSYHLLDVLKVHSVPAADVALKVAATGTVKGKVVKADGTPAGDAQVSIEPEGGAKVGKWSGGRNVNPDGTFQFDDVPPGRYTVSPNPGMARQGKDPGAKTIEVKAGETVEVELR